jgi:hypothetical protein
MKNFKIQIKSYDEKTDEYKIDKTYIVQRSTRSDLDILVTLQKEVLFHFFEADINIGEILRSNDAWETLKTFANNLNIVGKKEKGFDLEELADDIEQISRIFITQSITDEGTIERGIDDEIRWKPSLVSELHKLNFGLYFTEQVGEWRKRNNLLTEEEEAQEKTKS